MPKAAPDTSYAFEGRHRGSSESINAARETLCDWLHSIARSDFVQDAELVVSELASNAVEVAPNLEYVVHAAFDNEDLVLSVRNSGESAPPPPSEWGPDEPLSTRGRGLAIVRSLATSVQVRHEPGTTIVEARLAAKE